MQSVGIKQLKNELSRYVRLAAAGETVLVTDRDKVVAQITPPAPTEQTRNYRRDEEVLQDLARRGLARLATRSGPLPPKPPPVMTREELLAELDEDRADRF